jgi:hypothetical protein
MHFIQKFWHGHEDNTLNFNISQTDDSRNELTFDLVFSSTGNTITFNPSGSFSFDGAFPTFNSFTAGDGYKEYVLSLGLLNSTTNHTTTNVNQRTAHFKLTLADIANTGHVTWHASVDRFELIEGKGFIFEVKNTQGTEVTFSEIRFGDGAIDYEILQGATAANEFFYNLEDTTKMAL